MNRNSPRTEPCGTPYSSLEVVELDLNNGHIVSDHQGMRQTSWWQHHSYHMSFSTSAACRLTNAAVTCPNQRVVSWVKSWVRKSDSSCESSPVSKSQVNNSVETSNFSPEVGKYLHNHIQVDVGKDRISFEEIIGVYGFGEKILESCQSRRLTTSNTWFKKEDKKRITYKSGKADWLSDCFTAHRHKNWLIDWLLYGTSV